MYTGKLDAVADLTALCRALADAMLSVTDETGQPVFPTGGTRVRAYPAPHFAVADGGAAGRAAGLAADDGFVYLHLHMGRCRSDAAHRGAKVVGWGMGWRPRPAQPPVRGLLLRSCGRFDSRGACTGGAVSRTCSRFGVASVCACAGNRWGFSGVAGCCGPLGVLAGFMVVLSVGEVGQVQCE